MNARVWGCVLSALPLIACGHHSARQVAPDNPKHNLQVRNTSHKTVWVYVGRGGNGTVSAAWKGHVGKVHPGSTGYFRIERGKRKVYLRHRGESTLPRRSSRRFKIHFRSGEVHIIEDGVRRTLRREALPPPGTATVTSG